MSQTSQKDAVVAAVKQVLGTRYSALVPAKTVLSGTEIQQVRLLVIEGIRNGSVAYSKDTRDHAAIAKYVPSLVSDHLGRARELNGGVAKTPSGVSGSNRSAAKTKSNDIKLAALNKLLPMYPEGSSQRQVISEAIASRNTELTRNPNAISNDLPSANIDLMPGELLSIVAGL
jgi:hypothetical protein